MIDQSTVNRIIDAANIVDVVSDYVTLRRAGASYKGLCPFHDDKTPSFSVSPARGVCKCFSCGKGGNAVHFIMEMEQVGYAEALKMLAKKYGIQVEEREMTDEERQANSERESMFAVNEWAAKYFSDTMMNHQDGRAVGLAYFRSRGFRDDIIAKFRLGFCLDSPDAMLREAKTKGYKEQYLVSTGLCGKRDNGTTYDRFRGRAMFPWISVSGKVVAFGGRVLDARTKGVSQKYVNSPDSLIYHKANELYGIFQAKKAIAKEDCVFMVEGYTDVLAMHQCGIENVVANSGTALNEAQVRLLHRFTNNITLIYDGDEAGIHAATRSTDMLLAEGMNVKILLLPEGQDPDEFARKHNATEFKAYVAEHQTDFILFKSNLLLKDAARDPIKKANLTNDIIKSIAIIPDELVRTTYIHECSEVLGIAEDVLVRSTNKNRREMIEQIKRERQQAKERAERLAQGQTAGQQPSMVGQGSATGLPASSPTDAPGNLPPVDMPPFEPEEANDTNDINDINDPNDLSAPNDYSNTPKSRAEQRFIDIERMIMRLVARFGEQPIEGQDAEGNAVTLPLAQYVASDLQFDAIEFRSPLYSQMLAAVCSNISAPDFQASRFLLYHPDLAISRETAALLDDKYKLSSGNQMERTEEELKGVYLERLLLDYKNAIIDAELSECAAQLTLPDIKNDSGRYTAVLKRVMELQAIQRTLAKHLGDRVMRK